MIKIINYFFQSIIIYLFFIIGRLIGLKLSRKLFSYVFLKIAPLFKSKKIPFNHEEDLPKLCKMTVILHRALVSLIMDLARILKYQRQLEQS